MSNPFDGMTDTEYQGYVADMEEQAEAARLAWEAQMEQDARDAEEFYYVDFQMIPTLCDGCPLMDLWLEDQTFRAEVEWDRTVNA